MLYILGGIILTIFLIYGVVTLIGEIVLYLTYSKNNNAITLLKISKENEADAEYMLRSAVVREKWFGKKFSTKIICLDCGMTPQVRKICNAVCTEYPFMEIKTLNEFIDSLKI